MKPLDLPSTVLLIAGIVMLSVPPVGIVLLWVAFIVRRKFVADVTYHRTLLDKEHQIRRDRTRILAFKSLP